MPFPCSRRPCSLALSCQPFHAATASIHFTTHSIYPLLHSKKITSPLTSSPPRCPCPPSHPRAQTSSSPETTTSDAIRSVGQCGVATRAAGGDNLRIPPPCPRTSGVPSSGQMATATPAVVMSDDELTFLLPCITGVGIFVRVAGCTNEMIEAIHGYAYVKRFNW